jgi:hypothetical protein
MNDLSRSTWMKNGPQAGIDSMTAVIFGQQVAKVVADGNQFAAYPCAIGPPEALTRAAALRGLLSLTFLQRQARLWRRERGFYALIADGGERLQCFLRVCILARF